MANWPYYLARWRNIRQDILLRDLYQCQWPVGDGICGALLVPGRTDPNAAVVDHKTPHKGDEQLAFDEDNLWALCAFHHNSAKQQQERRGYVSDVGPDGVPIDPQHPFNRQKE